jgi:hypothetical protein
MPPAELEAEASALESLIDAVIVSLPPRYHFTIDNVHLHRDCLPAFILLHLFRHNLYIILGRARLMIYQQGAGDGAARSHLVPQLRRDRIARAVPMAGIVAEGLKVGANFCPQVGVQAYVALESTSRTLSGLGPSHFTDSYAIVLLFEPRRLAELDPAFDPRAQDVVDALPPLISVIRNLAKRSDLVRSLVSTFV